MLPQNLLRRFTSCPKRIQPIYKPNSLCTIPAAVYVTFQSRRFGSGYDSGQEEDMDLDKAGVRTKDSKTQESLLSLRSMLDLPLPEKVTGRQTPWVSQEDIEKYLWPLYSHNWGITLAPKACQLTKSFSFFDPQAVNRFADDVAGIYRRENHHPVMQVVDTHTLRIDVHTHSAVYPPKNVKRPGLTLRDCRLAVLIEHHLAREFSGQLILDRKNETSNLKQPRTFEDLEALSKF